MSVPLRVLIVEDSPNDTELLLRELHRAGYDPTYERVDTAEAMSLALDRCEWEIVIADYTMPRFSAVAALSLLQSRGMDLPFIIVSGTIGEETAVEAMRAGAHDYVMKGHLARLVPAIARELRDAGIRRLRRQAERALRESEERFRLFMEGVREYALFMLDAEGHVVTWNKGAERITEYSAEEILGRHFSCLYLPEEVQYEKPERELRAAVIEGRFEDEGWRVRKDGSRFWEQSTLTALRDEAGQLHGFACVIRDVTERRRAAEKEAWLQNVWEQERQVVAALQQSFVPRVMPAVPGFSFGHAYRAALQRERVGGDFYDVVLLDATHVAFCIGDVSGKGLEAALAAAMARHMWRGFLFEEHEPGDLLERLNDALGRYLAPEQFVTMTCGVLDGESGVLHYASAGHPPPMLRRAGGDCQMLTARGLVLGALPGQSYPTEELSLESDSLLLLYTDGLSELQAEGRMLEVDGVGAWLRDCPVTAPDEVIRHLYERAQQWSGDHLHDDIALLAIRRDGLASPARSESLLAASGHSASSRPLGSLLAPASATPLDRLH
jgi:PAS domain S-box-containing protein